MSIWSAIILGIIQGLTEFIPVSSTAHLILAPDLLGGIGVQRVPPAYEHPFDTIIQAGTLIPLLIYFRHEWLGLLRGLARVAMRRRVGNDPMERMAVLVVIGSIPAVVFGALLNKRVEALAEVEAHPIGYLVIGLALLLVGVLMWWVDRTAPQRRDEKQIVEVDAVFVGLAQAVALIPGVSRSGATITAGRCTGLTREAAARFSFLLAAPILLGATAYKAYGLLKSPTPVPHDVWTALLVGMVAAAVVGYFCIAFLLNYLRRNTLGIFAVYRIALGLFLIGFWWMQVHPR